MKDIVTILGLTLAACVTVGLIGGVVLHVLRRRSFRHLLTIATLIPVVAVVVTVLINVRLMFLSAHDSVVVLVALGASLLLAVLAAAVVTRRLVQASRQVARQVDLLVADSSSRVQVEAEHRRRTGAAQRARPGGQRPGRDPPDPGRVAGAGAGRRPARDASWSASCRTTSVRRWPASGRWPRASRTG